VTTTGTAQICGIVVHWHDEDQLRNLVEAWPADPRFELRIVDNGSTLELPDSTPILGGKGNLGFAGAVNRGLETTKAPLVLIMNSDVRPHPGAIESLIRGFQRWPDAAALAPRLIDARGASQCQWQLRPLPGVSTLLMHSLLLPAGQGSPNEPATGALVEQPAAAGLAVRRRVLEELGGLDERFYPAWFEDVDLAKRMQRRGQTIRYWPEAVFDHKLGSSVTRLGFGRFLRIYYTNLRRYLSKHHGWHWALVSRAILVPASLLRLMLIPIRKPRRATTRGEAAKGLIGLASNSLIGWPPAVTDEPPRLSTPGSPTATP
jgi:N-acetylglucosaminyl-diphospho-decaprenol L-rhamnosyltransferase